MSILQHRYYSFTYDKLYNQKPFLKDIGESASFQFSSRDITRLRTQMGKLIDKLSNVYKGGVITITDTVESLDINMESQDLEQVAEESNINLEPNTTATSGVSMSDSIVPAPSDSNVSILKSMRAQFYSIYGEVYNKIKEGGTTTITKS